MHYVQLKAELEAARREGREAQVDVTDLPDELADAYALALSLIPASEVSAWKIGGANPWSQAAFGNIMPFFGALSRKELLIGSTPVDLTGLVSPLAEPEVMLELAGLPDEEGNAVFSRMGLGIEIPASVLPAEAKKNLVGQIVDRAGAGLIWVGEIRAYDVGFLDKVTLSYGKSGGQMAYGGSHNVIGGPAGATRAFLKLARSLGAPLAAGQWIATAGLVKPVPVAPADTVTMQTSERSIDIPFV